MRIETVTILYQHPRILLGMKKKKFGIGKYNGFGGGLEENETLEQCAIRETFEETGKGIIIQNPERMGKILFQFETGEKDHLVYFFRASKYTGEFQESEEMTQEWFNINQIPYDRMWSDDKHWLPLLLDNTKFLGNFIFDANHQIRRYALQEAKTIV